MAVEHDGKAAFNRGVFFNYEDARSMADALEENEKFARVKPSSTRKLEVFPLTSDLFTQDFGPDHLLSSNGFDLAEANRNMVRMVEGFKGWGTPEEAQAFPPVSLSREPEKPQKMTVHERAAMLGVTVSALFYHKQAVGTPLTDQENRVLDRDWTAYQAKSSDKLKACKTKEAYLTWRRQCAARERAKARGQPRRSDDNQQPERPPVTFDALARIITCR